MLSTENLMKYYKNSFILNIIINFLIYLKKIKVFCNHSYVGEISYVLFEKTKVIVKNSLLLKKLFKQSSQFLNNNSFIMNILEYIINMPLTLLRRLYERFEIIINDSIVFKIIIAVVNRLEFLFAISLMSFFLVPDYLWHNIFFMVTVFIVLALFLKKCILQKLRFSLYIVDPVLTIFMFAVGMAFIFSIFPSLSLKFFIFYILCFLLVLMIANLFKTKKSLSKFLDFILIGVSISGSYGLYQHFTGAIPFDPSLMDAEINQGMPGRIFSTMGNPNNYAEVLILMLPFFLTVILNSKHLIKKGIFLILGVFPLAALFFTGSRSGWVAFAFSLGVFIFLKNRKMLPLVIFIGVVSIPFLPEYILKRFFTIFNTSDSSLKYRGVIFNVYWPVLKNFCVTGIGLGTDTFMKVINTQMQDPRGLGIGIVPLHTHNLYTQIWIETGIVGIVSFIWFVLRLVKNSIVKIIKYSDDYINNILIAGVSSISGVLIIGFVEYIWYYPRVMTIFWMVIGVMFAGLNILKNKVNV